MKITRTQKKNPKTRPKKSECARRRRHKVQRLRLIGLGVAEAVVDKMTPVEIRTMLKHPAKIKKS